MPITHEYLLNILHYEPKTGEWIWLIDKGKRGKKGKKAGSETGNYPNHHNYWRIIINNKTYLSHILAWFYMTKKWPKIKIDHKNRNGLDNKWENLRLASTSQNGANRIKHTNNISGYKGVNWNKIQKKYQSRIMLNGKRYHLGYFDCPIKAAKAYDEKAIEFFGEFAKLNFPPKVA